MFETLDNYINEILNEKPAFRDLVTSTYALLSDEQKRILNELLETPFNETLKDDILVILNSKDLDTLKQNVSEFLEKYPVAQNYKDEIIKNPQAMEIVNDFANLILNENATIPPTPIENPLYDLFLQTYAEFKSVAFQDVVNMFVKISCIYPKYKDLVQKNDPNLCDTYPFFMLVAHYLCIEGKAEVAGFNRSGGVVSSSSIDSVSVSYVAPPLKDNFQYFFSKTPYGQEYLAYINSNNVMLYVNNVKVRM